MPSPAPGYARKAIDVSMANDHAALESLRTAIESVLEVKDLAARASPLFVNASFCVDPEIAATPYVPMPLHRDETQGPFRIAPECESRLGSYQRAMLNLSRSMQLADRPIRGYLSKAHMEGRHWCGPPDPPDTSMVKSVGDAEARAAGAKWIMYVPVLGLRPSDHCLGLPQSDHCEADAVLLLWLNVPPPDDFRAPEDLGTKNLVSAIQRSGEVTRWAEHELRRLREGDATRYQLIVYLQHIEEFLKGQGTHAIGKANELIHEIGPYLVEAPLKPIALDQWLLWALNLQANPMNVVRGVNDKTVVHLDIDGSKESTNIASLRSSRPALMGVRVKDGEFAQKLIEEALGSIRAHQCRLRSIGIELTLRFCHIAFRISRGRPLSLDEYFAIRRGLFVPTTEGLGIGLALFSRRASMQGAFRSLYVSPDGDEWRVEVAVPVVRPGARQ